MTRTCRNSSCSRRPSMHDAQLYTDHSTQQPAGADGLSSSTDIHISSERVHSSSTNGRDSSSRDSHGNHTGSSKSTSMLASGSANSSSASFVDSNKLRYGGSSNSACCITALHCHSAKDMYSTGNHDSSSSHEEQGNTIPGANLGAKASPPAPMRVSSSGGFQPGTMDPLFMVDNLARPGCYTDVYAYFVYSTFRASSRWQLVQAVLGMLVTFLMQLGIIVLLWYGVIATMHKSAATGQIPAVDVSSSWRAVDSSVEMPLAIVNMLVVLALSVYALEEARQAVSLSITAAACLELLPPFYGGETFSSCSTAGRGLRDMCYGAWGRVATPVLRLLVLAAPILQHVIALLVLISAVDLTFLRSQTDIISIILDAAALVFLLELDSRVGAVLLHQHTQRMPALSGGVFSARNSIDGTSSHCMYCFSNKSASIMYQSNSNDKTDGINICQTGTAASFRKMLSMGQGRLSCRRIPSGLRNKLGHAYIAFVGLLVLCEPLFLSSTAMLGVHMSWLVPTLPGGLAGFKHNRGSLTLWTLYGDQGICILMPCKDSATSPLLQDRMPVLLAVLYPLLVLAMVLLLCGDMLPSVSRKWKQYTMVTQVMLSLAPHVLACGKRAMLILLPLLVVLSWLSLFVLWPLHWTVMHMVDTLFSHTPAQHMKQQQQQQQRWKQQHKHLQQQSSVVVHIPAGQSGSSHCTTNSASQCSAKTRFKDCDDTFTVPVGSGIAIGASGMCAL